MEGRYSAVANRAVISSRAANSCVEQAPVSTTFVAAAISGAALPQRVRSSAAHRIRRTTDDDEQRPGQSCHMSRRASGRAAGPRPHRQRRPPDHVREDGPRRGEAGRSPQTLVGALIAALIGFDSADVRRLLPCQDRWPSSRRQEIHRHAHGSYRSADQGRCLNAVGASIDTEPPPTTLKGEQAHGQCPMAHLHVA